jgi:hypothetical protein
MKAMRSSPSSSVYGRLGPLKSREFRLFFVGRTTSVLGSAMALVALSFAVLDEGRPVSDVGYVAGAGTLPMVVFLLYGGAVADRFPRRAVMVGADLARCVCDLVLAGLLLTGKPALSVIMLLSGLLGLGSAFFTPALTGLVPVLASGEHLQAANALIGVAESTGQVVGPAMAGVVVAAGGAGWAIAIDGATYAVSALCLANLHLGRQPRAPREPMVTQLRAGWREFCSRTWLWAIVAQFGLFSLVVYGPFIVLGAGVADTRLGGAAAWGTILTGYAVGSVLGGLAVLRLHPRRPLVTATLGTFGFAAPMALLALGAPAGWTAAAAAVSGAGIAVFGALWATTLQQQVPPAVLSRVSAYDWLGGAALAPVGFVVAGPVAGVLGVSTALWLGAGWTVVGSSVVLALPSIRKLGSLP